MSEKRLTTSGGFKPGSRTAAQDAVESMGLPDLTAEQLHAHINAALSTPSGKVLEKFLERHCYMSPVMNPEPVQDPVQIPLRQGRADLFRILQWWKDPKHFTKNTEGRHSQGSSGR